MSTLIDTINQIEDPAQRFALLYSGVEKGSISDKAVIREVCLSLVNGPFWNADQGVYLARNRKLDDLAKECEETLVRKQIKDRHYAAADTAFKFNRKDLALEACVAQKNYEKATSLAFELKDRRYITFLNQAIKETQEHHRKYLKNPRSYGCIEDLFFKVAKLSSEVDEKERGRELFLQGIELALERGDSKKALENLRVEGCVLRLFSKAETDIHQAKIYASINDYVSAAQCYQEAGELEKAQMMYQESKPFLANYENGIEIAEKILQDPRLAFEVAKKKAEEGGDWGRFYRYKEAAQRAKALGEEAEAQKLYQLAVNVGLHDNPGFDGMDGGTEPEDILKWSHEFVGAKETFKIYCTLAKNPYYHLQTVEYAWKNDLKTEALEFAPKVFEHLNKEGQLQKALNLATLLGDTQKQELYKGLLSQP